MAIPAPDRPLTFGDYLAWSGDERWELMDGTALAMTPSPSLAHQRLVSDLAGQLFTALRGSRCEFFVSPFDLRLPAPGESGSSSSTVVQPDLMVVCDPDKLDVRGCEGAPDLVVEVLSPGSAARDQVEKLELYERHRVPEYWIVDPESRVVSVWRLAGDRYGRPEVRRAEGALRSTAVPGLEIDWDQAFARFG